MKKKISLLVLSAFIVAAIAVVPACKKEEAAVEAPVAAPAPAAEAPAAPAAPEGAAPAAPAPVAPAAPAGK